MIQNGLCQNSENSCLYINLNKYVYLNHRNSFYDGFFVYVYVIVYDVLVLIIYNNNSFIINMIIKFEKCCK